MQSHHRYHWGLYLFLATTALMLPPLQAHAIELQYHLKPGIHFSMVSRSHAIFSMKLAGKPLGELQDKQQSVKASLTVEKIDTNGDMDVEYHFDSVKANLQKAETQTPELLDTQHPKNPAEIVLAHFLAQPVFAHLNRAGQVIRISGLQENMKAFQKEVDEKIPDKNQRDQVESYAAFLYSDQGIVQSFLEPLFIPFPQQPIRIGSSWTAERNARNSTAYVGMETRYTLKAIHPDGTVLIAFKTFLPEGKMKANHMEMSPTVLGSQGEYRLDSHTGLVKHVAESTEGVLETLSKTEGSPDGAIALELQTHEVSVAYRLDPGKPDPKESLPSISEALSQQKFSIPRPQPVVSKKESFEQLSQDVHAAESQGQFSLAKAYIEQYAKVKWPQSKSIHPSESDIANLNRLRLEVYSQEAENLIDKQHDAAANIDVQAALNNPEFQHLTEVQQDRLYYDLGRVQFNLKQYDAAITTYEKVLPFIKQQLANDGSVFPVFIMAQSNLAMAYGYTGNLTKADTMLKEVLALLGSHNSQSDTETEDPSLSWVIILDDLAWVAQQQQHLPQAEMYLRMALSKTVTDSAQEASQKKFLANVLVDEKRYNEAEALLNQSVSFFTQKNGPNAVNTAMTNTDLVHLYVISGQRQKALSLIPQAEPILQSAKEKYTAAFGKENAQTQKISQALKTLESDKGQLSDTSKPSTP